MGLMLRFLLLSVFALLSVAVKATEFHHTKISRTTTSGYGGRLLRTDAMNDDESRGLTMPIGLRIKSWIKKGKPDEYVMNKLKLTGLIGRALTEDPNFKYFQKFKVDGWLKKEASTTTAWDDLDIALGEVTKVDTFRIYEQYITELNKKAENIHWDQWSNLFGGGSETELVAKVLILKKLGRTNAFDIGNMVGSTGLLAYSRQFEEI
ncbi:hypothetical protein L915_14654 [Phytophthora nicotianae]|uniref:RxLR effector protein n=2 Tax=Phytophthora nicotianae TaxID=4792 RepID=W2GBD3_PHYNI|nr:hypothetical protein L915_14654 [Phytophthora nicotianae]